jgi:hypothetical protein
MDSVYQVEPDEKRKQTTKSDITPSPCNKQHLLEQTTVSLTNNVHTYLFEIVVVFQRHTRQQFVFRGPSRGLISTGGNWQQRRTFNTASKEKMNKNSKNKIPKMRFQY